MEDFASLLLAEQSNANVGIIQLLATPYHGEDVIVFVEGPDDPVFYYDFLSAYHPNREVIFIECGGKRGVLSTEANLKTYSLSVKPYKILFLCDSDFDPFIGKSRASPIFYTDFYSIESYFCHENYIRYLLNKHCTKEVGVRLAREISGYVRTKLVEATSKLLGPMAMACCMRSKGSQFEFDAISIADLISFSPNGDMAKKKMRAVDMQNKSKMTDASCTKKEVLAVARQMRCLPPQVWVRGKLLMQALKIIVGQANRHFSARTKGSFTKITQHLSSGALMLGRSYLGDIKNLRSYAS